MTVAIATYHLTKRYPKNRGIEDITLEIEPGEIFGFLGPNGAGKSTTLRTLLGFIRPTSGRAEILGLDCETQSDAIHARIGNLPGEFALDDRLTGRQFLDLVARLRGVRSEAERDHIAVALDADLDRPMRRLSRGNKQKIGIIQALFHRPAVIILDEPTGGLDPLAQETFLGLLTDARDRGQTVLFSSHVLSEVERIADRVGIVREGRLIAVEDPATLVSRSLRHVRIDFAAALGAEDVLAFRRIPGVEGVAVDGTTLRFALHDHADEAIKLAAHHTITAIDIERPSLEDSFLAFYGHEDGSKAA